MSNDLITCGVLLGIVVLLVCALSYCAARAGEELSRFYNELLREWTREAGHD
jgi:hypothetical protein